MERGWRSAPGGAPRSWLADEPQPTGRLPILEPQPSPTESATVGPLALSKSWPFLLLGLAILGVGVAAWRPVPAGVWHDDGVYMLVGKALAGGHGLTYQGVVGTPPAAKFPPLYPGLVALLWTVFRGIGAVTLAATLLNLAFLATAGALFAKTLHEGTGLSMRMSLAAAGLGFVSTDLLRTALVPLSESLFVLLLMGTLALWQRARDDDGARARALLGALLVATVATRTAGVAVAVSFAAAFLLARKRRAAALVTGPAFVTVVLWSAWSNAKAAEIAEGARDLLGPYGNWLADQAVSSPGAFLSALPPHAVGVFERIAAIFLPGLAGWPLGAAAFPLALVAIVGVLQLLRRFPPLGWFLLTYLGMLLVWPYLDRRLVAPLHPVIVAAVALGASHVLGRIRWKPAQAMLIGAAVLWVGAYTAVTAGRIANGWPAAPYRLRAERLATSVEALTRTAPPDAVIGAPEFWAALHLHGGWTVTPSVRFDPRSVDPDAPLWGTPEEQISLWRSAHVDVLLLEQAGMLHSAALDELEARCPGSVQILAQMPSTMVVQISPWDSTCSEEGRSPEALSPVDAGPTPAGGVGPVG